MMRTIGVLLAALAAAPALRAQVPQMIAHQGHVTSGGVEFHGTGQFKFALVNGLYGGNPGERFAFWTHDGTGSTVDPNVVPAGSVAVVCDHGQYSVLLGDTGAGMVPIPLSIFKQTDVRLRVWFNDGAHGFQQLAPDQRMGSVGWARLAEQASSVSDGAIGFSQLAKPVQSGTVSSIPITWDTATFSARFPRAFTAAPVVTLGVQSSDVALALGTRPFVTSATGSGFSAHVNVAAMREALGPFGANDIKDGFTAATLDGTPFYFYNSGHSAQIGRYDAASDTVSSPDFAGKLGDVVQVSAASLALVNGNPAFAALIWDGVTTSLVFNRATKVTDVSLWSGAPVTALAQANLSSPQLLSVNGAPAIFHSSAGSVRMIRANDANGTTWGAPVVVATDLASGVGTGDLVLSAKMVLGQPAVAYHSTTGLRYIRATNASGTAWGASVLLDAASAGTNLGVSLDVTSTLPSIAYFDSKNAALKFIRSSDFIGGGWNKPVTVAGGVKGKKVTLISIGGAPAISTLQADGFFLDGLHLVRATDTTGATWRAQVTVSDPRGRYGKQYPDVVLVTGQPGYFGDHSGVGFGLLYSPVTAPTITWMAQSP